MHPTLELQNLSQLQSHQSLALSAAKGSLDALRQVIALLSTDDYPRPDLLAPVFFANLDPSGISSQARLKASQSSDGSPIPRAILALKALATRNADGSGRVLTTDASPDVWPRVWKWIQLLDRYREDLVGVNPLPDTESYAIYCAIILRLQDHRGTREAIYATTGVRDVIARAWTVFMDNPRNPAVDLVSVCRFLLEDTISPINIDGLMMGSGCSITTLASLFAAHLTFVIPTPDSPVSNETLLLLRPVIRLLDAINYRNELWNSALVSGGIVSALIMTMRSLAVAPVDGADAMLDDCFTVLMRILMVTSQHQYIVDALKAGILHSIVLSRRYTVGAKFFLTVLLPRSTVYYSVLKSLGAELEKIQDLVEIARFPASETLEPWTKFVDFAETRLEIMRRYDTGDWLSGRHCDNLDCGKRMRTADQMRCSRCGTSYYCSKECQSIDWQEGPHRKVCARFRSLLLSDPETLNARDRSFMCPRHLRLPGE
ncbi:hypothetical protein DFH09DRAFT_470245 [Mycena vulgaris]|nr:hypothetical protein DFH09DRAFT_470245 [Mycena vulgaris]